MDGFIMAYIESMIQAKPHCHTENQRFGYLWLSKNSTHPQKPTHCKTVRTIFPALLLATNLLPLTCPGLRPTVQNSSYVQDYTEKSTF